MRRMIAILIISSFMLILSGCGAYKDADNEDIFVFSKEEQLYLSVNKKIFSRFDQAGRSIESSWVFPKNAYRFPKKVRVPLATESGLLTKATETIALLRECFCILNTHCNLHSKHDVKGFYIPPIAIVHE